jgi:pimeloyl-ACP methyl ester carboxylesterase
MKSAIPEDPTPAPSLGLLLREARVLLEVPRFLIGARTRRDLPRGDGHPVLLIPGFGADALAMRPLQRALIQLGYAAEDWGQGRNLGMRPQVKQGLAQKLESLAKRHDAKVTLIGWSLGGVFARELARAKPEFVRRVISMGSPINRQPDANNMMPLFRLANRGRPVKLDRDGFERRKIAPPVPCTAIYTRSDGIVAWQASLEESAANTENIEVRGSHFGLVVNLEVLSVIARRLADDAVKLSDGR